MTNAPKLSGGVYKIYRVANSGLIQIYIGSTANFERRFKKHKADLCNDKHHCKRLQALWNMCGSKADFIFEAIVELPRSVLLPTNTLTTVKVKNKEFREATEQLFLSLHYNDPRYQTLNTRLAYSRGNRAFIILSKVLRFAPNYDHLSPTAYVSLTHLFSIICSHIRTTAFKHMKQGDARKYWHRKGFFTVPSEDLSPEKYNHIQLSRLFQACYKGRLNSQDKDYLRKLILLNVMGKLHGEHP
ncbi:MAG: hypothetical protein COA90_07905 [Gammaproteobacteria bacterium]|nr:MAG: hypothetical protein COA90_07905 [Gammaproteobacteria bacterium]